MTQETKTLQQLKEMVGTEYDRALFSDLLRKLSNEELLDFEDYITKCRARCAEYLRNCRSRLRELNTTALHLRSEFKKASERAKDVMTEINSFFMKVFKDPKAAQENSLAYEQENGLEPTSNILKTQPDAFGVLNGFSLLGYTFGPEKTEAQHVAVRSNYAEMRKRLDEAKENMHYIRIVFKGA